MARPLVFTASVPRPHIGGVFAINFNFKETTVTNTNPETGIAYGYISANALDSELVDQLMYGTQAVDNDYEEALREYLRECREETPEDVDFDEDAHTQDFSDEYHCEEPNISGTLEGVDYAASWLGGALHFWVFHSERESTFRQCSPCVPGAADLDNPDSDGIVGYDVPQEWRREED